MGSVGANTNGEGRPNYRNKSLKSLSNTINKTEDVDELYAIRKELINRTSYRYSLEDRERARNLLDEVDRAISDLRRQ